MIKMLLEICPQNWPCGQKFQSQKKSLAQYNGDSQDWVDKCDPTQDTVAQKNPNGAGTYEEALKGSFKGVGVDCQGFAQKKTNTRCDGKPDCNGTNGKQGVDCCWAN